MDFFTTLTNPSSFDEFKSMSLANIREDESSFSNLKPLDGATTTLNFPVDQERDSACNSWCVIA
ncbi:hypothetical protein GYMLUDRAFT_38453 [Collybiopsis luxurians FD-317 M1]|nr:hypothetical protein GYMLUDRAFT_38453 [Collybiopsis luxurians FD-317 M1]